eukprot:424561-Rhodomonas_salina.1
MRRQWECRGGPRCASESLRPEGPRGAGAGGGGGAGLSGESAAQRERAVRVRRGPWCHVTDTTGGWGARTGVSER